MSTPTLINLPPPPSNPETPSEFGPGTPGSTTTSLSALSTTAIKDGHQGHAPPHVSSHPQHPSASSSNANTLDAERADRISRLAGLERVATVRSSSGSTYLAPGALGSGASTAAPPSSYFDAPNAQIKERSTVGSASATGSVGGRTTWASSSDVGNEADKMSEDPDDGVSSVGGLSDEGNASLVGFGEGASSTISGPVSRNPAMGSGSGTGTGSVRTPTASNRAANLPYVQSQTSALPGASSPVSTAEHQDSRLIDGMMYDSDVVDTADRTPPGVHQRSISDFGSEAEQLDELERRRG